MIIDMQIRKSNAKIHIYIHTNTIQHVFCNQREFGNMVTETKTSKNTNSVIIMDF